MNRNTLVRLGLIAVVALLASSGHAQTFSVIHTFTASGGDGALPDGGLTIRGGALYGATFGGGIGGYYGWGSVYQMTHVGSDWSYVPIFLFPANESGGVEPAARVLFGPDNHLYGTTYQGGPGYGGVVFRLAPPISICKTIACLLWTEYRLYGFQGPPDAAGPTSDLTWDQQGNIYGTTFYGGAQNVGTVYQLMPLGDIWNESVLHNFVGQPDGAKPNGAVVFDSRGNLWGTTSQGGLDNNNNGTVFRLTNVPGVGWQEVIVYNFQNGSDGAAPLAGLLLDSAGNLYGTSSSGGSGGGGTVFELSPSGNSFTFQVLYSFPANGGNAEASLTMDAAGNLYGTTRGGHGTVFKLTNTPNGWVHTSLHDFTGGSDGNNPASTVTIDTDGTLYGTTYSGGSLDSNCLGRGCGVVWMIKP